MTHRLIRDEFRVVRVYPGGPTVTVGTYWDERKAAQMIAASKAVLPNTPVKIQAREITTTYSDWSDLT